MRILPEGTSTGRLARRALAAALISVLGLAPTALAQTAPFPPGSGPFSPNPARAAATPAASPVPAVAATSAPAASPTPAATASPSAPVPAQPTPAEAASPTPAAASSTPTAEPEPQWTVTLDTTNMYVSPDDSADPAGTVRQFTYLQILGYQDEWAKVLNPRTKATFFVRSDALGPSDAPPAYITAPPPPAVETINQPGRVVGRATLAFYPTHDAEAQTNTIGHNAQVTIADTVEGDDGALWYRTSEGDYLPEASVRLPRAPARTFAGRWVDADLTEPAMLTAYDGDQIVMDTLTIKGSGAFQTPVGVFSIQRRVADETMSSDTIGIPRNGPGGYYLQHVLYTQYFTGDGASIHYNYWSSVWGYAGSHGCLGLPLDESLFMWNWATVGTPVWTHY